MTTDELNPVREDYVERELTGPVVVRHIQNDQSVSSIQEAFLLSEADFMRLRAGQSKTTWIAALLFSGVLGYSISLGPKVLPKITGGEMTIETGEWQTVVIGSCLSLLIFACGLLGTNEKKQVIKKISTHFKANRSRYAVTHGRRR